VWGKGGASLGIPNLGIPKRASRVVYRSGLESGPIYAWIGYRVVLNRYTGRKEGRKDRYTGIFMCLPMRPSTAVGYG